MSDGTHEGESVGAAQGVVARHDGEALLGDILVAHHLDGDVQVNLGIALEKGVDKVQSLDVAVGVDDLVNLIHMQKSLDKTDGKLGKLDIFLGQKFFNINVFFCDIEGCIVA